MDNAQPEDSVQNTEVANSELLPLHFQILKHSLDVHPDGIFWADSDNTIIDANETCHRFLGYSRDELVGMHIRQIDPIVTAEQLADEWRALRQNGHYVSETVLRRKDGSEFPVEIRSTIIRIGHAEYMCGFARDITERREAERALRENEEWFRTALETSPNPIVISHHASGNIVFLNSAFVNISGYSAKEVMGRTGAELGMWSEEDMRRLHHLVETQEVVHGFETWIHHPNGSQLLVRISARLQYLQNVPHVLVFARDVTDERAAEAALRSSREELRRLTQHLERAREDERKWIAREIHDELGQVLTALRMEVAGMMPNSPDEAPALSSKLAEMDSLLLSAVKSTKRISAHLRPILLEEVGFSGAMELLVHDFTLRSGIPCAQHVDIPDDLLDAERSAALYRILQEALNNVALHAKASHVRVDVRRQENEIILCVADDGAGFDPAAGVGKESFGLLGIRERAVSLGGSAEITSKIGEGTTLTVVIPVVASGGDHDSNPDRG